MGGMSIWHMMILLIIVLLIFGPSRLGDLGKSLGQAIRGFKKGMDEDPEIDVTKSTLREQLRTKNPDGTETVTTKTTEKDKA